MPFSLDIRRFAGIVSLVVLVIIAILLFAPGVRAALGVPGIVPVLSGEARLRWLVSLLPAILVANHGLFLFMVRSKQMPGPQSRSLGNSDEPILRSSQESRDVYFGARSLAPRYGIPAVLIVLLCSTALAALSRPDDYWCCRTWTEWPSVLRGARAGFAGAYLYTLLLLTGRTFRRDVTTGVATWCAAIYVVGPIISGTLALIWVGGQPAAGEQWSRDAVYFVAGMAPRQFAAIVQQAARRLVVANVAQAPTRVVPLGSVGGITPEIEERLSEEGITDVTTLAMADPILLLRSTSFDRRQIVSWIDEAILIITVPESWQKLENLGISGAIDLAWLSTRPDVVPLLATEIGMKAPLLQGVVERLYEDAQVRIVWTLYQVDSEAEFDPWNDDDGRVGRRDEPPRVE